LTFIDKTYSSALYDSKEAAFAKIQKSPQYRDGKFRDAVEWKQPTFTEYVGVMWEFLFGGEQRTPNRALPRQNIDMERFQDASKNQLTVFWAGHSSLFINIDGYKILTDPVFEKKVSILGPARFNGDAPLDVNKIPLVDVVIVSHNHYDHLNKYSIQLLNGKTKKFIVPLAVGAQLRQWGVPANKITELDWWEELKVTDELTITATPSQHFSGRGLTDRDKTLWASWVIKAPRHKVFFSGDSGYFEGFKKIGGKYGPFDMTFIECGAYNEKWRHIHMYPEETVQACLDLKGKLLQPIHWGTFNLSMHSWYEPMERVSKAAEAAGVKIATPVVGGITEYDKNIPTEKWWKQMITQNK